MTAISTLSGQLDTLPGASAGKDGAKELNDRFLKLLVAQMNNQDPLNPLDNAQVTSQMAQINTVTGINGLNDTVGKLLENFARLEAMQAAQLTGREVLVTGQTMRLGAEGAGTAAIQLTQPADQVVVEVRDGTGQVVREMRLGPQKDGLQRFSWDGQTASGARAPAGTYSFSVKATAGGREIGVTPLAAHRVEGVRQDAGVLQLVLTGLGPVAYSDIKQIL
jgi:flagellar basal-body rod modification protein FlgD